MAKRPLDYQMAVEDDILAQLRKIFETSAKELEKEINGKWSDSIGDALSKANAEAILRATKAHLAGDWADAATVLSQARKLAAAASAEAFLDGVGGRLTQLLGEKGKESLVRAQAVMAAERIDTVMARLSDSRRSLSSQVWSTKAMSNKWLDSKINQALARGWDAKRLAKEIGKFVNPDVPGGASYAAMRLARTEINNAFHSQTVQGMRDSGVVEYVKWNLSRSHPDRDICDDLAEHRLGEDIPGAPPKPADPKPPEMSKEFPGMTMEQENAVSRYTANSFAMNEKLRNGDSSDPMVKLIDEAIAGQTLDRRETVRRLITGDASYAAIRAYSDGEVYRDPAFMSTQKKSYGSIGELVDNFGQGERRPIVLEMDLPKGHNALDISGRLNSNPESLGFDQGEILLPRDAPFDITSVRNEDGVEVFTLRPRRR